MAPDVDDKTIESLTRTCYLLPAKAAENTPPSTTFFFYKKEFTGNKHKLIILAFPALAAPPEYPSDFFPPGDLATLCCSCS